MLIIGIDPGINGAICLFKDGKIVDVFEMPKMAVGKKNKSQVNASQIYNEILKNAIKDKRVSAKEALELVKKNSTTKFDESIDVSLKINLKQSKGGDLSLRTVVNLPNGSGKKSKVAVLCEPDKTDDAKKAGNIICSANKSLHNKMLKILKPISN